MMKGGSSLQNIVLNKTDQAMDNIQDVLNTQEVKDVDSDY
jgi:hypothetical protein